MKSNFVIMTISGLGLVACGAVVAHQLTMINFNLEDIATSVNNIDKRAGQIKYYKTKVANNIRPETAQKSKVPVAKPTIVDSEHRIVKLVQTLGNRISILEEKIKGIDNRPDETEQSNRQG